MDPSLTAYNDEIKASLTRNKMFKEIITLAKDIPKYLGESKSTTIHSDFFTFMSGILQCVGMYSPLKHMIAKAHEVQQVNVDTYTSSQFDFKIIDLYLMWKVLWSTTSGQAQRIVDSCRIDQFHDGDGFLALLKLKNNALPMTNRTLKLMKKDIEKNQQKYLIYPRFLGQYHVLVH